MKRDLYKDERKNPLHMPTIIIAALLGLIILIVAGVYLWPLRTTHLQTGTPQTISYSEATKRFDAKVAQEQSLKECNSRLYTHKQQTTKAVVMFHGVTACPQQFEGLAKVFYDAGYNVYVPLAPHHGLADKNTHGQVTANELVDYVNESVTIATGIGKEIGVVGLSGGGMLATWAAEYRPEVQQALVLSPFYEPAATQAPKWQLPLLSVLYGFSILPDKFIVPATPGGAAFSYHALANYNIVTKNLKSDPKDLPLKTLGVITSNDDDQIDLSLAHEIPQAIANANKGITFTEKKLPAEWQLGHDIVGLKNEKVSLRHDTLFKLYLNAYEGNPSDL